MDAKEYNKIMERLDFIEFRQQLLFDNDDVSRSIFEYGLTREQYKKIMDLMVWLPLVLSPMSRKESSFDDMPCGLNSGSSHGIF